MEETTICNLCLEPIFNHICVDCLAASVSKWIMAQDFSLLGDFKIFQDNLKNHFGSSSQHEKCIKCRASTDTVICPFCYTKEVFLWLEPKDENLAETFKKFFNFTFIGTDFFYLDDEMRNHVPAMITNTRRKHDMNICDSCENQSDDLIDVNGDYICEDCRDEIEKNI